MKNFLPLTLSLLATTLTSQIVHVINETGPRDKRVNMVVLAEGYTAPEEPLFVADVQSLVFSLIEEPFYDAFIDCFNIYAVFVPSNQSGTTHPGTAADCPPELGVFFKDTYFGSTFDLAGTHRALGVTNYSRVSSVLSATIPDYDIPAMLVNTDIYGGTGGVVAVFSNHEVASLIMIHEVGHTFARLDDEYDTPYPGFPIGEGPNTTRQTVRENIKWNEWIEPSTPIITPPEEIWGDVVGLFRGARYDAVNQYRPMLECMMRSLGPHFCRICDQQHVYQIYNRLGIIDYIHPNTELPVPFDAVLSVEPIPVSNELFSYTWKLNGETIDNSRRSLDLSMIILPSGENIVSVTVADTSGWIRETFYQHLKSDSVSWRIASTGISEAPRPGNMNISASPNPFNSAVLISISGAKAIHELHLQVEIFDLAGRCVDGISWQKAPTVSHVHEEFTWKPPESLHTGVYLLRASLGENISVKRLVYLK